VLRAPNGDESPFQIKTNNGEENLLFMSLQFFKIMEGNVLGNGACPLVLTKRLRLQKKIVTLCNSFIESSKDFFIFCGIIVNSHSFTVNYTRNKKMLDTQEVKKFAKACGADLVGIGNIERFEGAPKQFDPRYIMPEAKSIVVLGFRVFRGLYRGIEEGTLFSNYSSLGYVGINKVQMPMTLWNFTRIFEDNGYEAIPMHNDFPWNAINTADGELKENWSRPVAPGKPAPDVFLHMRIAAYIAGLGEIGWSKVFLTPEFGPRVRYAAVLTEAELEPDPLMEPGTICDRCMACARACTGNAISTTESVKIQIEDKVIEWGKLDTVKCTAAFQGGNPDKVETYTPRDDMEPNEYNPFIASPPPLYGYGRAIEGARGCVRACMIHLEEQGKLKNTFRQKFRRRPEWKMEPDEVES
jgi:ferredoxin